MTAIVADHRQPSCKRAGKSANFDLRSKVADLDKVSIIVLELDWKSMSVKMHRQNSYRAYLEILARHLDFVEGLVLVLDEPMTECLERMSLWLPV